MPQAPGRSVVTGSVSAPRATAVRSTRPCLTCRGSLVMVLKPGLPSRCGVRFRRGVPCSRSEFGLLRGCQIAWRSSPRLRSSLIFHLFFDFLSPPTHIPTPVIDLGPGLTWKLVAYPSSSAVPHCGAVSEGMHAGSTAGSIGDSQPDLIKAPTNIRSEELIHTGPLGRVAAAGGIRPDKALYTNAGPHPGQRFAR